jgi:hypothetical protein
MAFSTDPVAAFSRSGELHANSKLYTGELHAPTSLHSETARKY